MAFTLSVRCSLPHLFPSLFAALDRLRDHPYDAGWLLGCVSDVPLCFIITFVCTTGHVVHDVCLEKWVNGSAMCNANICPLDREQICDSRQRRYRTEGQNT
ncbi:hypothetical protein BU26DRAFT_590521 [Trematosphaeria pertusa]|uniref:RING-type domain-containing protein n=1 Tax=Trematosphaeria pertusa TaxID=390896 RepID=A0A6A6IRD6_9PLEO|nr:uncharacterized protein BU26DRAFT_590521 [Trematosphaeria pertusa]KAF2252150.1 hypothetical protein BU26DRAFT_590521 [Trematosphaeria pertusa]